MVVLLVLVVANWTLSAQGPLTRSAITLAESGQLEAAEYKIEAAIASSEGGLPMTWYVKAFILKDRYVAEGRLVDSPSRTEALSAAARCMELDPERALDAWMTPLLEFLAGSHLEDMRAAIPDAQPDTEVAAEAQFLAYATIQEMLDPAWDRTPEWVLLQQQLGEVGMAEAERRERKLAGPWFNLGVYHYGQAATRDHDRFRSLFNLAVHTYNQGVREFKAAEDDLDAIDGALNQAARHWEQAAKRMEEAILLQPRDSEAYEALAIISTALLNQDRIEWCKKHIRELGGGG